MTAYFIYTELKFDQRPKLCFVLQHYQDGGECCWACVRCREEEFLYNETSCKVSSIYCSHREPPVTFQTIIRAINMITQLFHNCLFLLFTMSSRVTGVGGPMGIKQVKFHSIATRALIFPQNVRRSQ